MFGGNDCGRPTIDLSPAHVVPQISNGWVTNASSIERRHRRSQEFVREILTPETDVICCECRDNRCHKLTRSSFEETAIFVEDEAAKC
jgi:hypothetical protein